MKFEFKKDELIWCLVLSLLFTAFLISLLYMDFSSQVYESKYDKYERYAEKFSDDSIILEISDSCRESVNPVRCVFDLVPMDYDYSRVGHSIPVFMMPEDYFIFGGVCRDVTILRKSVLDNLGIHCLFDFSTPRHVFLVCYYNETVYELNNGNFLERQD